VSLFILQDLNIEKVIVHELFQFCQDDGAIPLHICCFRCKREKGGKEEPSPEK
jgi:hypothetical protein